MSESSMKSGSPNLLMRARRHATGLRNLLLFIMCLSVTFMMGKDINADLLQYHVYLGHSLIQDRLGVDFMAAGPQSYLNPVGYMPLAAMLSMEWHSLAIAAVLAAIHSLNLVIVWEISHRYLFPGNPLKTQLAWLATLMAGCSPVFIGVLGGTFLDPTLSVFVLGSLFWLCRALESDGKERDKALMAAGLTLGLATGLKPTNIIFFLAAFATVLPFLDRGARWRAILILAITFGIGGMVTGGWWAWCLQREFGSPVFPLFNGIFKSPDFPPFNAGHDRFVPHSLWEGLSLPFRMAQHHSGVYVELFAPDLRFAALLLISVALVAKTIINCPRLRVELIVSSSQVITFVCIFFLLSLVLWLIASGNGRYWLSLLLLAGPLSVALLAKLFSSAKHAAVVSTLLLLAQVGHAGAAGYARWNSGPWTSNWIDVHVPEALRSTPYGYLRLSIDSDSFVVPKLAPGSAVLGLAGYEVITPDGAGSDRVRRFIAQHYGHLRILIRGEEPLGSSRFRSGESTSRVTDLANLRLMPWGLRVNSHDCLYIGVSLTHDPASGKDIPAENQRVSLGRYSILSCRVEHGEIGNAELEAERKRYAPIFEKVKQACPLLFPEPSSHLTKMHPVWMQRYAGTDAFVAVLDGRLSYSKYPFGPFGIDLGSVEDWESKNPPTIECRRTPRPW